MTVRYIEVPPGPLAAPWVECFWWREGEADARPIHRVLPDGCVDLLFDLSQAGEGRAEAWAVGTMLRALLRQPADREAFLGVRFRPGRASGFLRHPLRELTDRREPLEALIGLGASDLSDRLGTARTLAERVAILEPAVARQAARARAPEAWVRSAIDRVIDTGGRIEVRELARWAGVSRQFLGRRFTEELGISPKALCRVVRFRRLLRLTEEGPGRSWSDLALDAGYYDQAHMIGEVKRLSGTSPTELTAAREAVSISPRRPRPDQTACAP